MPNFNKQAFLEGYTSKLRTAGQLAGTMYSENEGALKDWLKNNKDVVFAGIAAGTYGAMKPANSNIGRILRALNYASLGSTGYAGAKQGLKYLQNQRKEYAGLQEEGISPTEAETQRAIKNKPKHIVESDAPIFTLEGF